MKPHLLCFREAIESTTSMSSIDGYESPFPLFSEKLSYRIDDKHELDRLIDMTPISLYFREAIESTTSMTSIDRNETHYFSIFGGSFS
jgi:hypothetical protein